MKQEFFYAKQLEIMSFTKHVLGDVYCGCS